MRKDSVSAVLCLFLLAAPVFGAKLLVLKNIHDGTIREVILSESKECDAVSLPVLSRAVNVMYEYDRITRKALLQNGNRLIQVADGVGFLSSFGEMTRCEGRPFVRGGAMHLPVQEMPAVLSGLGLPHYDWSVVDRDGNLPDVPEPPEPEKKEKQPAQPLPLALREEEKTGKDFFPDDSRQVLPVHAKNSLRFVVLDAGHGGQDPGGIGLTGLWEKTVVLKVSLMVERKLKERMPGVEVILTRKDNIFLPLGARTRTANQILREKKNGVFVSIHANISRNKQTAGYETYYLSDSTDEDARALAALENRALETEQSDLTVVNKVLSSMLDSELIRQSRLLAECVTEGYGRNLPGTPSRGVRTARFFVLDGALMPAILTEIGFLSNREEERKLRNDAYLEKIADGIVEGIVSFSRQFDRHNGFT